MEQKMIIEKLTVEGMTCISCENKIQEKLKDTKGINKVKVSYTTGKVEVNFDPAYISLDQIKRIIKDLDYEVVKLTEATKSKDRLTRTIEFLMIIISLYAVLNHFRLLSIFNAFPEAQAGMGYGLLFMIGLLTSVHCIGMCGGINLSQCALQPSINNNDQSRLSVLRASMMYNSGRVV